MSTPKYEQFDNDDEPPIFQTGPPPQHGQRALPQYGQTPVPQYGQTSMPQYGQTSFPMQSQQLPSRTNAVVVQQPQSIGPVRSPVPPDYIVWSYINCLCCLWPVGLCAIFVSIDARNKVEEGDIEGARASSRCALGLNLFSTLGGIAALIIIIIVQMHVLN